MFGLGAALMVALFCYHVPVPIAISPVGYGAAFGFFPICWIIIWALFLYRLTVETGKFQVVKDSIGNLTTDRRLQALLIAFGFGAFIEGAAGFGTPVAVAAAMLTGLGFSPFYTAAICLRPIPPSRLWFYRYPHGYARWNYGAAAPGGGEISGGLKVSPTCRNGRGHQRR